LRKYILKKIKLELEFGIKNTMNVEDIEDGLMDGNVYRCNEGICPKCGEMLPEHWKSEPPKKPGDTGFIRECPSCGTKLFCNTSGDSQQSNS